MTHLCKNRFISFNCEVNADDPTSRRVDITLGIISGLESPECERHEFCFHVPVPTRPYWEAALGVSGTIGLLSGVANPTDLMYLDQIVERNLADILSAFILEAVEDKDAIVIIKGPPLSKLIGRLAYRCFHRDATVAIFTYASPLAHGLVMEGYGKKPWCGPFPSLNEDSLRRTYFHVDSTGQPSVSSLRLDIFHQDMGFDDEAKTSLMGCLDSKIDKINNILANYPSKDRIAIPRQSELLDRSLKWSDEKMRRIANDNYQKLRDRGVPTDRLSRVIEHGIAGLDPQIQTSARMKRSSGQYAREEIFERVQRAVETKGGLVEGLAEFFRS